MFCRNLVMACLITVLTALPATAEEPAEAATIRIGEHLQLLVDRHLIDKLEGAAELCLHRPTMREVVIVHDEPWEGNTCGIHTVFRDGDVYRMYYRGWNHKGRHATHPPFVCYAESKDGIHWNKPALGLVEFDGSKQNNIISQGPDTRNFTPFKDANPDSADAARYKALGGIGKPGIFAFRSADGIHWERMADSPVITDGKFDSQNLAFWDTVRCEYRVYFRDWRDGIRDIKTATSKDFLHWSEALWLKYPGAKKEHLYTNQIQPYHRAPHLFIGFPSRYVPDRGELVEGLFMTSRDGRAFQRWQEAIIRPGLNVDRWHNRSNFIGWGLVETQSDLPGLGKELSLYTNERYYQGGGVKTRRYTYRLDGFVSVRAPFRGGSMLTRPLIFTGGKLLLNVSTSAAGSVRVEVQDSGGKPIDGYEASNCRDIYGDAFERTVKWRSGTDVSRLQGKSIRLLFHLKDADIYAFRFCDGGQQKTPEDTDRPRR